jgi:hypothetical protein
MMLIVTISLLVSHYLRLFSYTPFHFEFVAKNSLAQLHYYYRGLAKGRKKARGSRAGSSSERLASRVKLGF